MVLGMFKIPYPSPSPHILHDISCSIESMLTFEIATKPTSTSSPKSESLPIELFAIVVLR
jgi:hypothetical protein